MWQIPAGLSLVATVTTWIVAKPLGRLYIKKVSLGFLIVRMRQFISAQLWEILFQLVPFMPLTPFWPNMIALRADLNYRATFAFKAVQTLSMALGSAHYLREAH